MNQVGLYSLEFKIASDFDFLVRAFSNSDAEFHNLPYEIVKMRKGGISTAGISF